MLFQRDIFIPATCTFELTASAFEFTFELAFAIISIHIVQFFRVSFFQWFNPIPFKPFFGDLPAKIRFDQI